MGLGILGWGTAAVLGKVRVEIRAQWEGGSRASPSANEGFGGGSV